MSKKGLYQINLIPQKRLRYAVVGLILTSVLFAACTTVFVGVYSYINTYLGEDTDDTLILTQSGTGNFIATRYISTQIAQSAEYIQGISIISPETLTPCIIMEKTCFVRGIICEKFYTIESFEIKAGRWLTNDDLYGAFIGERAAKRLQINVNDNFIIHSGVRDSSLQLTAIGIFSSKDDALNDEIIVPLFAGQILSGNYPNRVTYIRVKYNDSVISRENLEELLISKHDLSVKLSSDELIPLAGGSIEIYDINGKLVKIGLSDSLGGANFILDFGNYTVKASYEEFQTNYSIFLQKDSEIFINLTIQQPNYNLNIEVLDENQIGIPYHTVVAWKGSEIIQMRQTNITGVASFSLPNSIYQFSTLFWNNFTNELVEFRQTANPIENETLTFWYRGFKLAISVTDPSSGLFLNATVAIKILNGTVIRTGNSDNFGYIEFEDLSPTNYNISVIFGAIEVYQIIELRSDRTVSFEILPQFYLEIHVYNHSTQLPINNSQITVCDSLNNCYKSVTDLNGSTTLLLNLNTYNVTVQAGLFSKSRIINLNCSRNETFWMPHYNLTVLVTNISGNYQNNVNISIFSTSMNESSLSEEGLVSFLVVPEVYNITMYYDNKLFSQLHAIFGPIDPVNFITPPYNLTIFVFNGTDEITSPLSGINITILNNETNSFVESSLTSSGITNFLLDPGIYNVTANISGEFYSKILNFEEYADSLTFYSYPFNLTISIFNGTTMKPQSDIAVSLEDLDNSFIIGPNSTNLNGKVSFYINPMVYNISISSINKTLFKIRDIKNPNTILTFDFPPFNLTIVVLNASNNSPVENAKVEVLSFNNNETIFSYATQAEGIAQFVLDAGKYYINLTYGTYNSIQVREITTDPVINYHIPPYKLTVRTIDYWNNPLSNANVTVNGELNLPTNITGYVDFYLQPNIYNISASWGEFREFRIVDMRNYQDSFQLVLKLVEKVSLNVSVINAISGRSLVNASVKIYEFLGEKIDLELTNEDGFCEFFLTPQVYNLTVMYEESFEYQLINLSSDFALTFSIIPLYVLSIFTFDDSMSYYSENVLVRIFELGGGLISESKTDAGGICTFDLEFGTYNITLQKDLEWKSAIIDLTQSEFRSFHMAPYKITVNVFNSTTSLPISDAIITISKLNGEHILSNSTNEWGSHDFLLGEGQYMISLNISGHYWVKQVVLENANASMTITFSISIKASSNIDIGDPAEYSASLLQQSLGLTESIVYILGIILTLFVSFGIMNVVSSSVSEARRNIGIIRSIGASNHQILYLINLRIILISIIAGLTGGLLGIFIGALISVGALEISLAQVLTGQLFISLLFLSIGMTAMIGLISSNLTLYRILRMPIATSIKEILPQAI